ncbi:MAG TPA: SDR family oxidoreductase [Solirubrobacterales bacterium]|nr:SDR family oxidoreductase [Solirubrobacterales bacterium]
MDVLIVGGHGQIALRLERLLVGAGHTARGVIRNPDHAADLEATGATPVVFDLEREDGLAQHVAGADAAVFAAGAGPGSGPARKRTVDLGGATKLIDACREAGVARYVIVSSIRADRPDTWSEEMRPYFEAKAAADAAVRESGLQYTIVRPGFLTNEPGTGRIEVGTVETPGEVSRDDVAATILAVLETPATIGVSFDLIGGETPIAEAVAALRPA